MYPLTVSALASRRRSGFSRDAFKANGIADKSAPTEAQSHLKRIMWTEPFIRSVNVRLSIAGRLAPQQRADRYSKKIVLLRRPSDSTHCCRPTRPATAACHANDQKQQPATERGPPATASQAPRQPA